MMNARHAALHTIADVILDGKSLSAALEPAKACLSTADQALYQALVYGTLREYPALAKLRDSLLKVPLDRKQPQVGIIMCLGIYQLLRMSLGDHGVLNETVKLAAANRAMNATSLINAVLRRVQRERGACTQQLDTYRILNLPSWLSAVYKSRVVELAAVNQQQAPFTLRIRGSREAWLAANPELGDANPLHPQAVTLKRGMDVHAIPGFDAGEVSIQDAAAQHAASLLAAENGMRVLDACAAPGGKTGHILELAPNAQVIALDHDERRLPRIQENLDRLGVGAILKNADAAELDSWWDGTPFDRILLDAPCSCAGIIRRHPDIAFLRTPDDLKQLPKTQMRLLKHLWQTLASGGRLLYATCSILPRENQQLIEQFLLTEPTAALLPAPVPNAEDTGFGSLRLPDSYGDGFFYALLEKRG